MIPGECGPPLGGSFPGADSPLRLSVLGRPSAGVTERDARNPPSARLGVWNGSLQLPRLDVGGAGDRECPVLPVPFLCGTRHLPVLLLWLRGAARALPVKRGHAQRSRGPAACRPGCQRVPFPGEGLPAGLTPWPPQPEDPAEPGAQPPVLRRRGMWEPGPRGPWGWVDPARFRSGLAPFCRHRGALCLSPALFVCDGCLSCARTSGSHSGGRLTSARGISKEGKAVLTVSAVRERSGNFICDRCSLGGGWP